MPYGFISFFSFRNICFVNQPHSYPYLLPVRFSLEKHSSLPLGEWVGGALLNAWFMLGWCAKLNGDNGKQHDSLWLDLWLFAWLCPLQCFLPFLWANTELDGVLVGLVGVDQNGDFSAVVSPRGAFRRAWSGKSCSICLASGNICFANQPHSYQYLLPMLFPLQMPETDISPFCQRNG